METATVTVSAKKSLRVSEYLPTADELLPSARAEETEAAEAKGAQAEAQLQPGQFPVDALNETQRRIAEDVATVHELPIELAAMPALAVTAAALGKGWKLTGAVNGRENFGNL